MAAALAADAFVRRLAAVGAEVVWLVTLQDYFLSIHRLYCINLLLVQSDTKPLTVGVDVLGVELLLPPTPHEIIAPARIPAIANLAHVPYFEFCLCVSMDKEYHAQLEMSRNVKTFYPRNALILLIK